MAFELINNAVKGLVFINRYSIRSLRDLATALQYGPRPFQNGTELSAHERVADDLLAGLGAATRR
jgi:hypothetical protein